MSTAAATISHRVATRRRVLALWLALLLPAVQALAGWHAVSHGAMPSAEPVRVIAVAVAVADAERGDRNAAALQACELCLTLAAAAHAAPATAPADVWAGHPAPFVAPVVAASCAGIASLLAYQGRAPPSFLL